MDANLISALVGAISALVGAVIGSATSLWATRKAHQNLLIIQRENQEALIRGLLQGLRTEVETIWEIYEKKFEGAIKLFMADEPISKKYHLFLYRTYFIIYDSNGSLIGQIPDSNLRVEIVTGYLRAKELIDAHLHNNKLVAKHEHWENLHKETAHPKYNEFAQVAKDDLKKHAEYIKGVYEDAKRRRDNFLNRDWNKEIPNPKTSTHLISD